MLCKLLHYVARAARRAANPAARDEQGQVLVWFLILIPLIVALIGLVVDGGLMYRWHRRAQIAADVAAQAAGHEIDAAQFKASNQVVLKSSAWEVAQQYATANYAGRTIRVLSVGVINNRIRVICRAQVPTIFMRMIGIEGAQTTVRAQAYPAYGLNVEGQ